MRGWVGSTASRRDGEEQTVFSLPGMEHRFVFFLADTLLRKKEFKESLLSEENSL
jgi:hypothetical protein